MSQGWGGLSGLRDKRLSHPAVPTCWQQGAAPGTLHWIQEVHAFLDLSSASETHECPEPASCQHFCTGGQGVSVQTPQECGRPQVMVG